MREVPEVDLFVEVERFGIAVVQFRQRDDVVRDGLQPLRFFVNLACKDLDVFGFRHAVFDEFRIA